MNTTRLYAHTSAAAAALLTVGAIYPYLHTPRWIAAATLVTACCLAWNARRCYEQARRERMVEQRLQRLGHNHRQAVAEPSSPCCSFWRHTDNQVHGPDCTRPAPAPTGLTPAEQQAFEQLTQLFHETGDAA